MMEKEMRRGMIHTAMEIKPPEWLDRRRRRLKLRVYEQLPEHTCALRAMDGDGAA